MPSIYSAIPAHCDRCGRDFESKRQRMLHVGRGLCKPISETSSYTEKTATVERRTSYGYNNQDDTNKPSTTTTPTGPPFREMAQQSPQSFHSPQSYLAPDNAHRYSSAGNSPLPPDVAAARINRTNKNLSFRFRIQRDPRRSDIPAIQGNGTYTHVNSQTAGHYSPEPQFLPLGGPQRHERANRGESELPEAVNRAYEALAKVLREEERLTKEGNHRDPRLRYAALPVPGSSPAVVGHPPPPPPLQQDTGLARPPPPDSPVDTFMGGMGSVEDRNNTAKSATATTIDANRDPRLKRRNTDDVYGRR